LSNYFAKQYCFTRKCLFSGKVDFFDQKSQSACRSNGSIFFKIWQNERFLIRTWFLCFTPTLSFLDFDKRFRNQVDKQTLPTTDVMGKFFKKNKKSCQHLTGSTTLIPVFFKKKNPRSKEKSTKVIKIMIFKEKVCFLKFSWNFFWKKGVLFKEKVCFLEYFRGFASI